MLFNPEPTTHADLKELIDFKVGVSPYFRNKAVAGKWVQDGKDDNAPEILQYLFDSTIVHNTAVRFAANILSSVKFVTDIESDTVSAAIARFEKIQGELAFDLALFGRSAYTLQDKYDASGVNYLSPKRQSPTTWRFAVDKELNVTGLLLSKNFKANSASKNYLDWANNTKNNLFLPFKQDGKQIVTAYHLEVGINDYYYTRPFYFSFAAVNFAAAEYKLSAGIRSETFNGFSGGGIVSTYRDKQNDDACVKKIYNNDGEIVDETPEQATERIDDELLTDVKKNMTGEHNRGTVIFSNPLPITLNDKGEQVPYFTLDFKAFDNTFDIDKAIKTNEFILKNILLAHGLSDSLIYGLSIGGITNDGSKQLVTMYKLYVMSVISEMAKSLEKALNHYLRQSGIEAVATAKIADMFTVEASEILLTQILSNDELRAYYKI